MLALNTGPNLMENAASKCGIIACIVYLALAHEVFCILQIVQFLSKYDELLTTSDSP